MKHLKWIFIIFLSTNSQIPKINVPLRTNSNSTCCGENSIFSYEPIDPIYIPMNERVHTGFSDDLPSNQTSKTETITLQPRREQTYQQDLINIDYNIVNKTKDIIIDNDKKTIPEIPGKKPAQPVNYYYTINQTYETKEGEKIDLEILRKINDLNTLIDQTTNRLLLDQQNQILDILRAIIQSLQKQKPIQGQLSSQEISKITQVVNQIIKQNQNQDSQYLQQYIEQLNNQKSYFEQLLVSYNKNIEDGLSQLIKQIQIKVNNNFTQQQNDLDKEIQEIINRLKNVIESFNEKLSMLQKQRIQLEELIQRQATINQSQQKQFSNFMSLNKQLQSDFISQQKTIQQQYLSQQQQMIQKLQNDTLKKIQSQKNTLNQMIQEISTSISTTGQNQSSIDIDTLISEVETQFQNEILRLRKMIIQEIERDQDLNQQRTKFITELQQSIKQILLNINLNVNNQNGGNNGGGNGGSNQEINAQFPNDLITEEQLIQLLGALLTQINNTISNLKFDIDLSNIIIINGSGGNGGGDGDNGTGTGISTTDNGGTSQTLEFTQDGKSIRPTEKLFNVQFGNQTTLPPTLGDGKLFTVVRRNQNQNN